MVSIIDAVTRVRSSLPSVDAGLAAHLVAVAVVNIGFFGYLKISGFPFLIFSGTASSEGPNWHLPYSHPIVWTALGLLIWTALVPLERKDGQMSKVNRWVHSLLMLTAAFNCIVAFGYLGLLTAANKDIPSDHRPWNLRYDPKS